MGKVGFRRNWREGVGVNMVKLHCTHAVNSPRMNTKIILNKIFS